MPKYRTFEVSGEDPLGSLEGGRMGLGAGVVGRWVVGLEGALKQPLLAPMSYLLNKRRFWIFSNTFRRNLFNGFLGRS